MRHSILTALVLAALSGCGDAGPRLIKVTGTVTNNGKPYADALVEFAPDRSNAEFTAGSDTTGPQGNFMIRSVGGRSGLAPGKYTVKISKAPPAPAGATTGADEPPTPKNDPGQQLAEQAASPKRKAAAADTEGPTGTFPAEVSAANHEFDFDVKSK